MTARPTRLRAPWGGILIGAALPACLLVAACDDKSKTAAPDTTAASAESAEPTAAAAEVDVEPPAAVVAEDPAIPLHEAVVGAAPVAPDFYATAAPPEAIVEDLPPKPAPDNVWIPGYWWWSRPLARYVWVTGAWRNPPPNVSWSPGSWVASVPGQWVWSPGFWGPRGFAREAAVIDVGPPPVRVEVMGPRPDPLFMWTPGYYAYRESAYVWVGGSWMRPPVVGLGWIEPRYVGFGPRFFFQPGRWDFAPAYRGTVYMPVIDVHVGGHFSPAPVSVAVVSAHAGYVSASAAAIAHGATRTASGGYHGGASVSTHGGGASKGETHGGSHGEPSGGSHEPAGPSHAGEPSHGSTEPSHGSTEPSHGSTEPSHGSTEPSHGSTEPAHGNTEPASTTHLGGSTHGGAAPPSHGGSTPPSHGSPPPGHGGKPNK